MKWNILLIVFALNRAILMAQVPSFGQIQVSSNIDSLQNRLFTQRDKGRLATLLCLEKSLLSWEMRIDTTYLDQIKQVLSKYPEAQGHYWYFNSWRQRLKTNSGQAFTYAKAAYTYYKAHNDSTGMVSALSNMGIIILERDEQNSSDKPHFGHKYLEQAMALSRHSSNPELQILYTYALGRIVGLKSLNKSGKQIVPQLRKALALIDQYPQYIHYKTQLLNILTLLYWSNGRLKDAQKSTLAIIHLIKQHGRKVPIAHLYNLGFYYEMQQNYDKALDAYRVAWEATYRPDGPSVRYRWLTSAGIHASLVGLKHYKEAATWADSIYTYGEAFDAENVKTKLQETVVAYELEKKEAQNKLLMQEKKLAEMQNRLYIGFDLLATLGLFITGFLIYRQRLTNKKLKEALAEISQINQSRDYFFGVIAHDLRRPFTSFKELAALASYYLNKKRYAELQKISQSIDDMGRHTLLLLDNLLSWALTQREEIPHNPENVQLSEKIRGVAELYQSVAQHQQVQILTECPEHLTVYMDANACELILRNLVDNALKSLQTGGKIILKAFGGNGADPVKVVVKDTGRGMSFEKIAALKNILTGLSSSALSRGLGMVLVGRFSKSNHITVDLRSTPGEGTEVELTFTG
ncbi:sensor histidine kinase [Spirosoma panaciterrae]|uniref:sensor histidine kinase n=1 Tax=Spirosoma panaciterrae TaxID=496058 RepID=UPI000362A6C9|nr:HAMP domain-containing sensor histidine kinase [Spirosoma panaciterrae]